MVLVAAVGRAWCSRWGSSPGVARRDRLAVLLLRRDASPPGARLAADQLFSRSPRGVVLVRVCTPSSPTHSVREHFGASRRWSATPWSVLLRACPTLGPLPWSLHALAASRSAVPLRVHSVAVELSLQRGFVIVFFTIASSLALYVLPRSLRSRSHGWLAGRPLLKRDGLSWRSQGGTAGSRRRRGGADRW